MGAKRIMTVAALAMGLAGLGTGTALAADGAKGKKGKDDASRRICKAVTPVGTRLSTRVCRTQAQWDESMDKAQEGVLDHQMGPGTTSRPLGDPE